MSDNPQATPGAAVIPLDRAPFTFKTLQAVASTDFVPAALRGKPNSILAAILTGRELGLGPMESLRSIDVIDGRPSPSAEWMVGRVFEAGHVIEVVEQTDTSCTVKGIRYHDGEKRSEMSFTFTIEMARRVPQKIQGKWKTLADKSNWKNYPEAMLYWRAVSQLIRQFFPDVIRGVKYTVDEMGGDRPEYVVVEEQHYPEPAEETIVDADSGEMIEDAEEVEIIEIEPVWGPEPTGQADEQAIGEVVKLLAEVDGDIALLKDKMHEVLQSHDGWLAEPMETIELNVRFVCRAMEALGIWQSDNVLRENLAKTEFRHISDMKRDQLIQFARNIVIKATLATQKENA